MDVRDEEFADQKIESRIYIIRTFNDSLPKLDMIKIAVKSDNYINVISISSPAQFK